MKSLFKVYRLQFWRLLQFFISGNYNSLTLLQIAADFILKNYGSLHFYSFLSKFLKNNGGDLHLQITTIFHIKNCAEIIKSQTCADLQPKKFPDATSGSFEQALNVLINAMCCSTLFGVEQQTLCKPTPLKNT